MEHGMTGEIKTYSESFRRQVVAEYETGSSLGELKRKYGIGGQATITKWIAKYGSAGLRHKLVRIQSAAEANRVKALEQQVVQLERALAKMTLEKLKLESTLEVLQEQQGTDVMKKNAR
jgi:transposase-like protein